MNIFATMDALLRDPESVYELAARGEGLGRLCLKLLLIFAVTAGVYGAAMGCFRWVHPEYYFSDFELSSPAGETYRGKIAGVNFAKMTVYTVRDDLPEMAQAEVRFNIDRPSDVYQVQSVGQQQSYGAIVLAPGSVVRESAAWRMPLLVALKTPLLFILTLALCAMALYVLNLAFEIRLHFMPVMTTMAFGLAATGVMLGVLVPITGLFSIVTADYHFMKVMHWFAFMIAGSFGVKILYRGLVRLSSNGTSRVSKLVIVCLLLYCIVGGQVAWTLKPFLGTPYLPETPPFRVESGNVYVNFFNSLSHVTSGVQATRYHSTTQDRAQ